ncbi:unnamed protein product [Rotaria socialis]|uniref:Uncharacterized protein n=1 Tax=Rotaria socialis TaxID=392032 RepID=A0A820ZS60_9BILA|nr:unnamed protein product [Rotaria socialis]
MHSMSINLRQKLKELNKQKEQFNEDSQNVDIQKSFTTTPVQLKKTVLKQQILHPKSLNINNNDITLTAEELNRREQEFNDDMQRECGQNAQWKKIQQNTFTRWANERLKLVNRHIDNLQTDLGDGLNLIALLEILVGKKLPRYNHRPQFRSQKLENVSVVLDYVENIEKRRLVNIDASDIVDGKVKLILGLMWTLILHYSITLPAWEIPNEKRETIQNLKPKQKLMNWLQAKLPTHINIANFTSDWNDGRAIGAVLESCYPGIHGSFLLLDTNDFFKHHWIGLFPNWADRDPKHALENAKEAMELAEKWLGIPQLIQPHEMINPHVDEQSMMTYLSQYPNAKLQPGAPVKPKNYAHLVNCYGEGLERTGHMVDKPVIFHIETCAAGIGKVDVIIVNPNGQTEECTIEFREDRNRTYDCAFYPAMYGEHKIIVTFNEQEVRHSPFYIYVDEPEQISEVLDNDEVDTACNEVTHSDIEQPVYENYNPANAIIYDREDTADIKIKNLNEDGDGDDIILQEDHIYYAHQTQITSIQDHQLRRQISTRSISDPTLNKHKFFSPIKPPRTYCHDEPDDEINESPLVYSLTDYRLKQKRQEGLDLAQANRADSIAISSTTLNSTSSISIDDNPQENKRLTSKWLVIDEISRLTELTKRETSTLTQTSHALKCCSNDPHAALSDKKIECERVIFMAKQKLTSYNSEIKRLENLDPDSEYYSSDISHSTLILQDIRLSIKEDYLRSLRKGKETKFYFFMCAVHYRSQTLFSHMVSSFDTLQSNGQEITMKHPITGLDHSPMVCPHHHVSSLAKTVQCMKCDKQRLNSTVSIPGQHSKTNTILRVSNFVQVDAITIRKEDLKTQEFMLSISSASIPLKAKLHVKLQRLSELKIRKAGYLTIYCDISGSGVWIRRWFILTNEQNLRYWPSPDDEENNVPPTGEIDLHYCIDQTVNLLQRETCARPHTFELRIAVPTKKSTDHRLFASENDENDEYPTNSIIAQPFGKRTLFRFWLSADSKEDRNDWCNILNQILADLREWEVIS